MTCLIYLKKRFYFYFFSFKWIEKQDNKIKVKGIKRGANKLSCISTVGYVVCMPISVHYFNSLLAKQS